MTEQDDVAKVSSSFALEMPKRSWYELRDCHRLQHIVAESSTIVELIERLVIRRNHAFWTILECLKQHKQSESALEGRTTFLLPRGASQTMTTHIQTRMCVNIWLRHLIIEALISACHVLRMDVRY